MGALADALLFVIAPVARGSPTVGRTSSVIVIVQGDALGAFVTVTVGVALATNATAVVPQVLIVAPWPPVAVLNSKPAGALSTIVPFVRSPAACSVTVAVTVVNAPSPGAAAAWSAEIWTDGPEAW